MVIESGRDLFKNFNRIIFASYIGLVLIAIYLFRIEYMGVYRSALDQTDLYFSFEERIFNQASQHPITSKNSVLVIKKDAYTFGFINRNGQGTLYSGSSITEGLSSESVFPKNLQSQADELLKTLPPRQRTLVGDYWVYKATLLPSGKTFLAFGSNTLIKEHAFYEAVDTLYSIIGALTALLVVVYLLIGREFIRPAKALVNHLSQESKGISKPPPMQGEWQVWATTITDVFAENRRLVNDLEDHIKNLDHQVLERTQELRDKNRQLRKTMQGLKDAQDQIILQEKMASLGSLTAGIAHEMKNPLNFVINFSEVSQELIQDLLESLTVVADKLPLSLQEETKELAKNLSQNMELIREHGQRADHIVRSMLLHAHGGQTEHQNVDVNQLLTENLDLAISGFKGHHRDFQVSVKKNLDAQNPQVFGVPGDVGRVFLNIIANACHAIWERSKQEKGGNYNPQVTVSTRELEKKVEIRIRDNGTGIPEDARRKIFEPFFTTKSPGHGTGLGLSMCYEMITRHGGTVDIDTQAGQYTEFIIYLPKAVK